MTSDVTKDSTINGTRSSSSTPTRLGAVALAATMLAACQATPGGNDAPQHILPSETTVTPPAPPVVAQQGPLDEFAMRILGTANANATLAEHQAAAENRIRMEQANIAACMAAQGFTYLPDLRFPTVSIVAGPQPGTREFAEQFGLGISSNMPGMPGSIVEEGRGGYQGDNPNFETQRAMSAAEIEAWNYALYGDQRTQVDALMEALAAGELPPVHLFGCLGAAMNPQYSSDGNDEFRAIHAEFYRFRASIDNDVRLDPLNLEWSICLAEQGFPGRRSPQQLRDDMRAEWQAIHDYENLSAMVAHHNWDAQPEGPPNWVINRLNELSEEQGLPSAVAAPAFRELEAVLAVADVDCREQLQFDARRTAIEQQIQQDFVDLHRNELEAWATWAENRRAGR